MFTKKSVSSLFTFLAFGSGLGSSAMAQPAGSQGGEPPGPPPEAVAACVGKTEGTKVSFTGHGGQTFTGTCQKIGDQLAARPTAPGPQSSSTR